MHKIVFFGTSDFAVPSLIALMRDGRFHVAAVVTQPDRPVGRHAVMTPPPVKDVVAGIPVAGMTDTLIIKQPEKIKDEDFSAWIKDIGPTCDAFVVVSYGKILPQWLLDLPKHGVVNVHGSLLPRWRGASPVQAAIAAGDAVSGVSIMRLDALMDHGPLIATVEEPIRPDDTGGDLHDRLAELGGRILPDILADYLGGKIAPIEQDHDKATSCHILTREHGKLDATKDAIEIEHLVRAYDPWPGTWTEKDGKRIKISASRIGISVKGKEPGERFVRDGIPCLTCAGGSVLELLRLQPEGKASMDGETYLRGNAWT